MNKTLMAQILSRITEPVDIVLLEGIHCAWFIDVIQDRFPGKKIILRQSNVEHMVLSRNGEVSKNILIKMFYKDQARLMRGFEKQAMEQVDGVTAISASDESWFLKDVPGIKSMVVPAGADLPEIRFKRTEQKCLLAVSNWRWQPNIDGLIWFINTIWPVLKKRNPGLRFLVAGDGIPKRLKNNRHAGGIAFLGFVDDVEFYRQQATVLVIPLLSGSGIKLKVLEGLASALPVVTTPMGAEGIEITHREHYLLARDKTEFINCTDELLKDAKLREGLSANGRNLIKEKYSWKAQTKKLEKFLEEVYSR
ncbi:MAG: glycosyltransferase family 4 protein [Balneolales bacterium]